MITIRKTQITDLPRLMKIFEEAKHIMRQDGNMKQWTKGYPTEQVIRQDIEAQHSYVCLNEQNEIVATFAFIIGKDPTYATIYQGEWLEDTQQYGTIHRLASTADSKGIAEACLHFCEQQIHNLRADTHRDNHILQHILLKHGFQYCGIIFLMNGDERLAYQRIRKK